MQSSNLNAYSQILANTADTSGGGIRLTGTARLFALQPHTLIGFNKALNGYGGGLEVLGPARADIGSQGFNSLGVIDGNDAQYGGGIDILTFDDDQHAIVRLFSTDPNDPVEISDNLATHAGGAVYLKPLVGIASRADAVLCASDFRINGNSAPEGAAIYSDADYASFPSDLELGGKISLNTNPAFISNNHSPDNYCVQTEATSALGGVACAPGVACNELKGNKAVDEDEQPTDGSTILLQNASALYADRFTASQNAGAHLVREVDSATAFLSNCLLTDNNVTQELGAQTGGSVLSINSCTIANNWIGAPFAFLTPGFIILYNSIVDQPGRNTIDPAIVASDLNAGAFVSVADFDLTNDASTLPGNAHVYQGQPTFVDAAHGDYHLVPGSLGVDYAPSQVDDTYLYISLLDRDGKDRFVDLSTLPNRYGPLDLGAYEVQVSAVLACALSDDTIFCDPL